MDDDLVNPVLNMIGMFGTIIVFFLIYVFMPNPQPLKRCRFSITDPEIIIIGAGIAGASLAAALGQKGRRVVVIERDMSLLDSKTDGSADQGDYLFPSGIRALQDMNIHIFQKISPLIVRCQRQPVNGFVLMSHQTKDEIKEDFPAPGRPIRYRTLVTMIRRYAAMQSTVKFVEGVGTQLMKENDRVVGVKYYERNVQEIKILRAPLTVVCDGFKSKLRSDVTNSADKLSDIGFVISIELQNLVPRHSLHREIRFGLPFGQTILETLNGDATFLQFFCHGKPPSDINSFIENNVVPVLPDYIQNSLAKALKQSVKCEPMTFERLETPYDNIPGVLLLGDAFSKSYKPAIVSDINVILNDVEFWQRNLCDICDLRAEDDFFLQKKAAFKRKRKYYSKVTSLLSHAFATFLEQNRSSVRLRQSFFHNLRRLQKSAKDTSNREIEYSLFEMDGTKLRSFCNQICLDALLMCVSTDILTAPWTTAKDIYEILTKYWTVMNH